MEKNNKTAEEVLTIDFIVDSVLPQHRSPGNMMHTTMEVRRIALREYIKEYASLQSSDKDERIKELEKYVKDRIDYLALTEAKCLQDIDTMPPGSIERSGQWTLIRSLGDRKGELKMLQSTLNPQSNG